MLEIYVPEMELFDDENEQFTTVKEQTLHLEHSLVSLAKWESKWHEPFLAKKDKTYDEMMDYIACMTLENGVSPMVYRCLPQTEIDRVAKYIDDPMTATWFNEMSPQTGKNEIITAEIIYYWMVVLRIPIEMEKWHLNRLMTLIKVINIKQQQPKPMNKKEAARIRAVENARRRAKYKSKG